MTNVGTYSNVSAKYQEVIDPPIEIVHKIVYKKIKLLVFTL